MGQPRRLTGAVLCATDLTERSDEALRQAHEAARVRRLKVVALHVLPDPLGHHPLMPTARKVQYAKLPEAHVRAADAVRRQAERVLGRAASAVEVRIEHGTPYAVIVQQAEDLRAGVVVVGAPPSAIGSVAARVVRYAHGPVLVARPGSEGEIVLAATDLSDAALPAVAAAVDQARRHRLQVALLHVVDLRPFMVQPDLGTGVPIQLTDELGDSLVASARDRLGRALRRFRVKGALLVETGLPADVIVEQAARSGIGLLVLGTAGATGLKRMLLGSVAESVLQRVTCSVLVVRKSGHRKARSR